jgi:hypothetical protein
MLYSPSDLNKAFKKSFNLLGWDHHKVECNYEQGTYLENYRPSPTSGVKPFRDMDFIKNPKKLGVEVQWDLQVRGVSNIDVPVLILGIDV